MNKYLSLFVLVCSLTNCDGALLTGRISGLQGSQGCFYWGDGAHDLYQSWSVNDKNSSGWFYGSTRGDSNVDVYVCAGLQGPMSIENASVFPYWDSSSKTYPGPWGLTYAAWAQEGDTVFFRGTNGYYGAWYIENIYYDPTNPRDYAALDGIWYFLDDGSADFSVLSETDVPGNDSTGVVDPLLGQ